MGWLKRWFIAEDLWALWAALDLATGRTPRLLEDARHIARLSAARSRALSAREAKPRPGRTAR